jgi:hypothetical protein
MNISTADMYAGGERRFHDSDKSSGAAIATGLIGALEDQ